MRKFDEQLAALATMSSALLRAEWRRVFREVAPDLGDDLLRRDIAYRLQERARGGLAPDIRRRIAKLVREADGAGQKIEAPQAVTLRPGTRLVRDWHGKTHQVLVLDDGFLFEDRRYASLTRIACDITGANWSGPRFFGLKQRGAGKAGAQRG
jgi:hypothetical protein